MKFKKILFSLSIFLVTNSAYSASLLEVYQQALQADPRIHEAEARHLASLEIAPQARSALLPQIQFRGSVENSNNSSLTMLAALVPKIPIIAISSSTEAYLSNAIICSLKS